MPSAATSRGARWRELRLRVLERDSYICAYCGNDADEADHIIPKVQGGKDEMSNLVAACKRCNGTKSDRVLARINYVNKRWLARL